MAITSLQYIASCKLVSEAYLRSGYPGEYACKIWILCIFLLFSMSYIFVFWVEKNNCCFGKCWVLIDLKGGVFSVAVTIGLKIIWNIDFCLLLITLISVCFLISMIWIYGFVDWKFELQRIFLWWYNGSL